MGCVLAILLLLLSELPRGAPKQEKETTAQAMSDVDHAAEIEQRLTSLISAIEGVGKVKVMVTLESSAERIYARDTQSDSQQTGESGGRLENRSSYILIDASDGETGLLLKIVQPRVRGVAVVCEGAESATVRKNILDAVTAVLDLPTSAVSVTQGGGKE